MRDDEHPYLAYSPIISIEDSSVPFRAFLGAILSVVEDVPVEPSDFGPHMQLDTIVEAKVTSMTVQVNIQVIRVQELIHQLAPKSVPVPPLLTRRSSR